MRCWLLITASVAAATTDEQAVEPWVAMLPPLLSRRAASLAPTSLTLVIGDGGALALMLGPVSFEVSSSFSEVGPHWNNMNASSGGGGGWSSGPAVDRSRAAEGRWVVVASARNYTLRRVIQLDPPLVPGSQLRGSGSTVTARRILVNDTIASTASAPIGMIVRHRAGVLEGSVGSAVVPGILNAGMCGTEDNPDNFGGKDRDHTAMNGEAPHLWLNATAGGGSAAALGLVAFDDVFRVHAQCRNLAVAQLLPRVPSSCEVSSPPSIQLSDPNFALPPGASHTLEWGVYASTNCTDFFCFVNALRSDYGTDDIVIGEHTGVLGPMENGADADVDDMGEWSISGYVDPRCNNSLPPADRGGICENWTDWSSAALQEYMLREGVNVMPVANAISWGGDLPCGGRMELNGAAFVRGENPPTSGCGDCYARLEEKIRRVIHTAKRVSTRERPVRTSYYMDVSLSTGALDWVTYASARVLDEDGKQVLYRPCSAKDKQFENLTAAVQGQMPLFFGTTTNSYGKMIKQYVDKVFALGFDGVYHDGYAYSAVTYTYGTWDNFSCFLNPTDLSIRALPGSIQLLSMPLEVELQAIIKANGGFFTANGAPVTRTIMQGKHGVHFLEDSEHTRVKHVQTYTPVMLNRVGVSQAGDIDPKYNRSGNVSGAAVCWNIKNHLDDGVLVSAVAPLIVPARCLNWLDISNEANEK